MKDHGSNYSLDSTGLGSSAAGNNSNDSLASLMAPPPRNISMSSMGSNDRLSSFMNPPDRRPTQMMMPEPMGAVNTNVRIWSPLQATTPANPDAHKKQTRKIDNSLSAMAGIFKDERKDNLNDFGDGERAVVPDESIDDRRANGSFDVGNNASSSGVSAADSSKK